MRLLYLDIELSSTDPTLEGVMATLCMQIQISYAIIAMTTPCLRPFMSALNTHYGGPKETRTPNGSKASRSAKSDNSYSLPSLSRSKGEPKGERTLAEATPASRHDPEAAPVTRWDRADYRVAIMSRNLSIGGGSTQSNESQRMIISKNTEWQVDFGDDGTRSTQTPKPMNPDDIGVAKG